MQNFLNFTKEKENSQFNQPIVIHKADPSVNKAESQTLARIAEKRVKFDPQLEFIIKPTIADTKPITISKERPKTAKQTKQSKKKKPAKSKSSKAIKTVSKIPAQQDSQWNSSFKSGLFDTSIKKEMLDPKKRKAMPKEPKIQPKDMTEEDRLHETLSLLKNGKTKSIEVYRSLSLLKEELATKQTIPKKRGRMVEKGNARKDSKVKATRSSETYKDISEIERILKRGTSRDIITEFTPSELNLIRQNERILENLRNQLGQEKVSREKLEGEIKSKLDFITKQIVKHNEPNKEKQEQPPQPSKVRNAMPKKKAEKKKPKKKFGYKPKPALPIKSESQDKNNLESLIKEEIEEDIRTCLPVQQPKPQYQEVHDILYQQPKEKMFKLDQQTANFLDNVQSQMTHVQKMFFEESNHQGIVGIVSRFAGKFIMSQADKLADMILNEMLLDTAVEMTNIENEMKDTHLKREQMEMMTNLLLNIEEAEAKQEEVKFKYQHEKREYTAKVNRTYNIFNLFEDPQPSVQSIVKQANIFIKDEETKMQYTELKIPESSLQSIMKYKLRYEEYLRSINSSGSADLFKIYDFIAVDLMNETLANAMQDASKDLEDILDKMILNEFGVNSVRSSASH